MLWFGLVCFNICMHGLAWHVSSCMHGLAWHALVVVCMVWFGLASFSSCVFGLVWQTLAVGCLFWFGNY